MYRRKRILLLSSSIILLCACLIAGATFALFTDTTTVRTHLKAGELNAHLIRESAYRTVLSDQGEMTKIYVNDDVNFTDESEGSKGNFFGFKEGELIVPMSEAEAVFKIENKGSVAFVYDVDIVFDSDTEETDEAQLAANAALASQLYVELGTAELDAVAEDGRSTYDYTKVGEAVPLNTFVTEDGTYRIVGGNEKRVVMGGQSELLYVRITFKDDGNNVDNNKAMNGAAAFDLIVTATQYTEVTEKNESVTD